jgi:hypothetical protein
MSRTIAELARHGRLSVSCRGGQYQARRLPTGPLHTGATLEEVVMLAVKEPIG